MKSGTSLVHELLAQHPAIAMADGRKEVMFFDRHYDRGVDWYARHFAHAGDRVCGEVTPGYLFHPAAAARIAELLPGARLFAVLRDPVERAYSQYCFFVKEHGYTGDVDRFLQEHPNATGRGRYHEQLRRYLDHFAAEQLVVQLFEELVADPTSHVSALYAHLGVDPTFTPERASERRNARGQPRMHGLYTLGRRAVGWLYEHDLGHVVQAAKAAGLKRVFVRPGGPRDVFSPMSAHTRARLTEHYRPDVDALASMLGRDLTTVWPSLRPDADA